MSGGAGGAVGAGGTAAAKAKRALAACGGGGSAAGAPPLPTGLAAAAGAPSAMTADLASLFECPVCFDYVLPPILQCQSGHLVCSSCRPKLTCCPTCRGPLGNIRNLAMEKVAGNVMFPCKHSATGCGATLVHTEKVYFGVDLNFRTSVPKDVFECSKVEGNKNIKKIVCILTFNKSPAVSDKKQRRAVCRLILM